MHHIQRRATTIPAPIVVNPTQKFDGNDGSWSTFEIQIGTPPQSVRLLISTASSETWAVVPEGCISSDPPSCASSRGADPFNGQASEGFSVNSSSTWTQVGLYSLDLESALNYTGNGLYGYDVVGFNGGNSSGGISLGNQVVAGIADKSYYMGLLGLSDRPTSFSSSSKPVNSFMWNLAADNLIPSLSFGYTAGASYQNKGVFGDLVLGGYDSSRFKNSGLSFSFASSDARNLQVGVQSIVGSNTLLGVNSFTTKGGHLSLVDSSVSELWLPPEVCDNFQTALGLTYDNSTGRYLVNNTIHSQLQSLNPSFTFKLGNTAYDNGNSTDIVLPYAAFDLTIGYPVYSSSKNYFPIRRATSDSQYTIGRVLLQEAYLVVDYERKNFTLNQAVFTDPLPASKIVTIRSPSSGSGSSKLSTGAIVGIAVAGAVVLIALAVFLWWFLRRRRRQAGSKAAELDGKQKEGEDADGAAKYGKPHDPTAGYAEVSADNQIAELGAPLESEPGAFAKVRPGSNVSELPAPAPVFEMPGDTLYYGDNTPQRSPRPTSTLKGATPRPSPLSPNRQSAASPMASPGVTTNDTWYRQPSPNR